MGLSGAWSIAWVNGIGGMVIGACLALVERGSLAGNWRLLAVTGFLGGFTTFSAFTGDLLQMLREGQLRSFALLALASNLGALLAAASGFYLLRAILR